MKLIKPKFPVLCAAYKPSDVGVSSLGMVSVGKNLSEVGSAMPRSHKLAVSALFDRSACL